MGSRRGQLFSFRLPLVGQGCQQTSHPSYVEWKWGRGGASKWPTVNKMGEGLGRKCLNDWGCGGAGPSMQMGEGDPGENVQLGGAPRWIVHSGRVLGKVCSWQAPDPQVREWAAGLEFQPQWDAYLDTATKEVGKIRDKGASELPEAPHLVGAGRLRALPDTQNTDNPWGRLRLGFLLQAPACNCTWLLSSPLPTSPPTSFSVPLRGKEGLNS